MSPERRVIVTRRELTATRGVDIPLALPLLEYMKLILLERLPGLKFKLLYSKDHFALGIIMEDEGVPINPERRTKRHKGIKAQPIDSASPEGTPISNS